MNAPFCTSSLKYFSLILGDMVRAFSLVYSLLPNVNVHGPMEYVGTPAVYRYCIGNISLMPLYTSVINSLLNNGDSVCATNSPSSFKSYI